jgi:hypothetical protein
VKGVITGTTQPAKLYIPVKQEKGGMNYMSKDRIVSNFTDVIPTGMFSGGDQIPEGTFHGGDKIPEGTFHT